MPRSLEDIISDLRKDATPSSSIFASHLFHFKSDNYVREGGLKKDGQDLFQIFLDRKTSQNTAAFRPVYLDQLIDGLSSLEATLGHYVRYLNTSPGHYSKTIEIPIVITVKGTNHIFGLKIQFKGDSATHRHAWVAQDITYISQIQNPKTNRTTYAKILGPLETALGMTISPTHVPKSHTAPISRVGAKTPNDWVTSAKAIVYFLHNSTLEFNNGEFQKRCEKIRTSATTPNQPSHSLESVTNSSGRMTRDVSTTINASLLSKIREEKVETTGDKFFRRLKFTFKGSDDQAKQNRHNGPHLNKNGTIDLIKLGILSLYTHFNESLLAGYILFIFRRLEVLIFKLGYIPYAAVKMYKAWDNLMNDRKVTRSAIRFVMGWVGFAAFIYIDLFLFPGVLTNLVPFSGLPGPAAELNNTLRMILIGYAGAAVSIFFTKHLIRCASFLKTWWQNGKGFTNPQKNQVDIKGKDGDWLKKHSTGLLTETIKAIIQFSNRKTYENTILGGFAVNPTRQHEYESYRRIPVLLKQHTTEGLKAAGELIEKELGVLETRESFLKGNPDTSQEATAFHDAFANAYKQYDNQGKLIPQNGNGKDPLVPKESAYPNEKQVQAAIHHVKKNDPSYRANYYTFWKAAEVWKAEKAREVFENTFFITESVESPGI